MKNLSVIICTKDRPDDLTRLLNSLKIQAIQPELVIIVDGSDKPLKNDILPFFDHFNIDYVTVRPPALPKQRNVGIGRIPKDIEWVAFLDDDLELFPNTLQEISHAVANYHGKKPLGALCMIIENTHYVPYSFLRSLWLLDNKDSGRFSCSGIPSTLRKTDKVEEVEWVSGGTTVWKADVLRNFKYDEWFEGTGYLEDVEYSYRVSREHTLLLCGPAKCYHHNHPVPSHKMTALGLWQIVTSWYFVNKHKHFNMFCTLWSLLGIFMNNFVMGILSPKSLRFKKALGNMQAFWLILNGQALAPRKFHK